MKQDFYGRMCDYEIQQLYIKDVEWIKKTKQMVVEREERNARIQAEYKERQEIKRKNREEAMARKEEEKRRQEEIRKQREAERKEREEALLKQLDTNPFNDQIDLCESLIYFTTKQGNLRNEAESKDAQDDDDETKNNERAAATKKKLDEAVKQGKIEIGIPKGQKSAMAAAQEQQKGKKGSRRNEKANMYMYEEGFNLDHPTIVKFGNLDVSPPVDSSEAENTVKTLTTLRDALKLAGKIEQAEGKARLTGDDSHVESDEFKSMKEEYEKVDYAITKKVDSIKHMNKFGTKLTLNNYDEDDEFADREAGSAAGYTRLRPNNRQQRYDDGDRDRRRNQSRRRDDRDQRPR